MLQYPEIFTKVFEKLLRWAVRQMGVVQRVVLVVLK